MGEQKNRRQTHRLNKKSQVTKNSDTKDDIIKYYFIKRTYFKQYSKETVPYKNQKTCRDMNLKKIIKLKGGMLYKLTLNFRLRLQT